MSLQVTHQQAMICVSYIILESAIYLPVAYIGVKVAAHHSNVDERVAVGELFIKHRKLAIFFALVAAHVATDILFAMIRKEPFA